MGGGKSTKMSEKQLGGFSSTHWSEELWSRDANLSTVLHMHISLEMRYLNFWFKIVKYVRNGDKRENVAWWSGLQGSDAGFSSGKAQLFYLNQW